MNRRESHESSLGAVRWGLVVAAVLLVAATPADEPAAAAARAGHENFNDKAWSSLGRGAEWKAIGDNEIHQLDKDEPWRNNGYFKMVEQGDTMSYRYDVKLATEKGGAGLFVMASDPQGVERGNSYLLYYFHEKKGAGKPQALLSVAKFVKDKLDEKWNPKFKLATQPGEWLSFEVTIATRTGEVVARCNGKEVGRSKDPAPIKTGRVVCLHTCGAPAQFRNVSMERSK